YYFDIQHPSTIITLFPYTTLFRSSNLEHHANIVPWQLLSQKNGFKIKVIPVNDAGELLIDEYKKLFTDKTKLVSFTHVSNALGRSEEHTSELESRENLVCRLLLEK